MNREVKNKLLLLKLISLSKRINKQKLRHIVFILEAEGRNERKQTFNYQFVRWNCDPYSLELEKDIEHLFFEGMIKEDEGIVITNKGHNVIAHKEDYFLENKTDSFFKFYLYLYMDSPIEKLVELIYRKYELAKHQINASILEIRNEKSSTPKTKKVTNRELTPPSLEQIEKAEEEYVERIKLLFEQLSSKNDVG